MGFGSGLRCFRKKALFRAWNSYTCVRFSSSKPTSVPRLRFAPSPTGLLHLGGLRTALYNYLMCRNTGGAFVLRIEDTDRARTLPGAVDNIINSLDWMGISADEGPHCGGAFAPYVQSERVQIYRDHAEKLVKDGAAYRCFCSPLRLEILRKDAVKTGAVPGYDNKCRSLTQKELFERSTQGIPFVIRLKMSEKLYEFEDEIHGHVSFDAGREGDPVILKSDGFPTYHLANVIDDHLMEITHVLRGIEWQISTPKHLQLYSAFGWLPPKFAHLPLLLNPDGSKLSKRQGALEILEYKRLGYHPEALLTLLAQVGGGFRSRVAQSMDIITKEDLIRDFDLSRINKNSCQVSMEKLAVFNKQITSQIFKDPVKLDQFIVDAKEILFRKYGIKPTEEAVRRVVRWAETRLSSVTDLTSDDLEFVWIRRNLPQPLTDEQRKFLHQAISFFQDFSNDTTGGSNFSKALQSFAKDNGFDMKSAMHAFRLALTGMPKGPSIVEIVQVLGPVECASRIRSVIDQKFNTNVESHVTYQKNKTLNG